MRPKQRLRVGHGLVDDFLRPLRLRLCSDVDVQVFGSRHVVCGEDEDLLLKHNVLERMKRNITTGLTASSGAQRYRTCVPYPTFNTSAGTFQIAMRAGCSSLALTRSVWEENILRSGIARCRSCLCRAQGAGK